MLIAGSYNNVTGIKSEDECTVCPGGWYCEGLGLTWPSGLCGEGYYCPPGSSQKEPPDNFCPVGNYCPAGVSQPLPCRNNSHVSMLDISSLHYR